MSLTGTDLKKIGTLMDERLLKFHGEVTEPMINNIVGMLREDMGRLETKTDNNAYRLERKVDAVLDHHSEKIDNHEKRVILLEEVAFP